MKRTIILIVILTLVATVASVNVEEELKEARETLPAVLEGNENLRYQLSALQDKIAAKKQLIADTLGDKERLQKQKQFLTQQIHDSAVSEKVHLLQKHKADHANDEAVQMIKTLMHDANTINDNDIEMEALQRSAIQRLFLLRFLWQVEIEAARKTRFVQRAMEVGGVLLSTSALYLSGGSTVLFMKGLRWYCEKSIQNQLVDLCVRSLVRSAPRILYYAGGTLTNELKMHGARQAELLLTLVTRHVEQVAVMLEDTRLKHGAIYDEVVQMLGTTDGIRTWLANEDNQAFHDVCVRDIEETILTDSRIIQRKAVGDVSIRK